jgi:hypothetical protein
MPASRTGARLTPNLVEHLLGGRPTIGIFACHRSVSPCSLPVAFARRRRFKRLVLVAVSYARPLSRTHQGLSERRVSSTRQPPLASTTSNTGGFDYAVGGGVAAFDCTSDGRSSLYFAGGSEPAALYRNDSPVGGPLRFTRIESPVTDLTGVMGAYPMYDATGGLHARAPSPFSLTFVVRRATGARWLNVAVLPSDAADAVAR